MIIEYELKGSITTHKGIFDTTGFHVVMEEDREVIDANRFVHNGWKIYGMCMFSYFHEDFAVVNEVYRVLCDVIDGMLRLDIDGVGYIRRIK